jgi:hypothetical protein
MPTPPRQQTTPQIADSATTSTKGLQVFRILTLAAAGMAALLALFPPVGHDQLWCLYVAQRMLDGARLYGPELFESNPPLVMWGSLVLAHTAQLTHVPITVLFKLAVAAIELASALLSLRILHLLYPGMKPGTRWFLAFAYVVIYAVVPARDFGQRDHLLAVLCLPYVLAAALDASQQNRVPHVSPLRRGSGAASLSTSLRILIGLAAAIGICLKPHHALIILATESLLLVFKGSRQAVPLKGTASALPPISTDANGFSRRGTLFSQSLFRPELLTIAATGGVYLYAVRTQTSEYLTQVVPLLKDVYWAIGHLSPMQLLGESIQLHILALIVIALYLRKKRSPFLTFLILAGIASTAAYYLQGTGWYYQQIPALSFFAAALGLQFAEVSDNFLPTWTPAAALGLSILTLGLTAHFTGYPFIPSRSFPIDAPDESFFAGLAPGTPVAILTTSVDDTVMPVAKYHLLWAQRTNNLWIMPALLRNESGPTPRHTIPPARLAELEALQHRFMVEDLNRWHPRLILINRCQDPKVQCQVIEDRHDDLLAWFSRDPAFRAAFAPYHFVASKGDFDAYTLRSSNTP